MKSKSRKGSVATIIETTFENLSDDIKCNCVVLYLSITFDLLNIASLWLNYPNMALVI
jgi:hypothetical protein